MREFSLICNEFGLNGIQSMVPFLKRTVGISPDSKLSRMIISHNISQHRVLQISLAHCDLSKFCPFGSAIQITSRHLHITRSHSHSFLIWTALKFTNNKIALAERMTAPIDYTNRSAALHTEDTHKTAALTAENLRQTAALLMLRTQR